MATTLLDAGPGTTVTTPGDLKAKLDSVGAAPAFAVNTAYGLSAIVQYEGKLYRCKAAVAADNTATPDSDTAHWEALSLASDFMTIVKLTDGAETMGSIAERLGVINGSAQAQHVMFDVGAIVTTPQLYLCTIYIDSANSILRLVDSVTGKSYTGTYNASETLSQVLAKAKDSFVNIVVTATTQDGVTVTGQTVSLWGGADKSSGTPIETAAYNGQPVTFTVARGTEYYIEITSTIPNHFSPNTAHGVANELTLITLTYQDTSNIITFAGIQGFLQSIAEDETLTTDAERIAFAQNALLPEGNTAKEIADTWTDDNGTVYDNPMVVMDIKYYEDENGDRHLGCKMERKWVTHFTPEVDARETVVKCSADEVGVSGIGYFSWCAAYDNNSKSYSVNSHCHYNGTVYKCLTAYTSATTDATPDSDVQHWQAVADPDSEEYLYSTVANQCVPFKVPYTAKVYEQTGATNYYGIYKNGAGVEWYSYFAATRYGCNRWSHSGLRQYLNSDGAAGTWWASQHIGDEAPSYHITRRGYKAGCTAALVAAAKKFKVETINWDDTATQYGDSGKYIDVCYDTFSIDSITEVFGVNSFGEEGTYDLYWKRAVGIDAPTSDRSTGRVRYRQDNHANSIVTMLRSADRNCSRSGMKAVVGTYYVEGSPAPGTIWGYAGYCSASTRRGGVAPCCVIW